MKDIEPLEIEKKNRWPGLVAGLFVLFSLAFSAYLGWMAYSLEQSKERLQIAIETQKSNLIELEQREQIGEKMRAAELLRKAQAYRRNWSEALLDVNEELLSKAPVEFTSVNFTMDNEVQVNGMAQDFLTAAGFLMVVKESDKFENAFISNISPDGFTDGETGYSFNATFNYAPEGTASEQ